MSASTSALAAVSTVVLQTGGLLNTPLGQLLVAIVALGAIVLVGRLVLHVAWKLLLVAGVVVGVLYAASLIFP